MVSSLSVWNYSAFNWIKLLVLLFPVAQAVIPKICVQNITATGGSGVCCPEPIGSVQPCGGVGIGTCQQEYVQYEPLPPFLLRDDRMMWPARFFKFMCKCEGNYFGVACEECWYGWEGPLCNKRQKLVRRDIKSYTPEERSMFVNVVSKMPYVPSGYVIQFEKEVIYSDPLWKPKFIDADLQYYIAYIHRYVSRATLFHENIQCEVFMNVNNNHNVVGFSTWHRYLMMYWERELRKIAIDMYDWSEFAIPYWDWVDADNCEVCVNSLVGAPGPWVNGIRLIHPDSPFSKWPEQCTIPTIGSHCYGCHASWPNFNLLNRHYYANEFPETSELEFALSRRNFYLPQHSEDSTKCRGFHQALEGFCGAPNSNGTYLYMHNKVHNMVKGSFCCAATAANDPLFILHHSQMDRIWQVWFEHFNPSPTAYPNHGIEPGNCRECNIIGFLPTVRHTQMFQDMRQLGIYYDNLKFGKRGFDGDMFIKYGPSYHAGEME